MDIKNRLVVANGEGKGILGFLFIALFIMSYQVLLDIASGNANGGCWFLWIKTDVQVR